MQQFLHENLRKRLHPGLTGNKSTFQMDLMYYDWCHCSSLRANATTS